MPQPPPGDHYAALGVSASASHETIRQAHRRIMREVHPDVTGNDPRSAARAQRVNQAWAVLRNPSTRADYDRRRDEARRADHRADRVHQRPPADPAEIPSWGPGGLRPVTIEQLREAARLEAAYSHLSRDSREAFATTSRRWALAVFAVGAVLLLALTSVG